MANFYQEQYRQYLNQTVRWFKATGENSNAEPTFTPSTGTDIKVRKVNKTRQLKDRDGKEKVSTTAIMTIEDIAEGDYIADAGITVYTSGREVLSTHNAVDPDGNFIGKTARL